MDYSEMKPAELRDLLAEQGLDVPEGDLRTKEWRDRAVSKLEFEFNTDDLAEKENSQGIACDAPWSTSPEGPDISTVQRGIDTIEAIKQYALDTSTQTETMEFPRQFGTVRLQLEQAAQALQIAADHMIGARDQFKAAFELCESMRRDRERAARAAKEPAPPKRYISCVQLSRGSDHTEVQDFWPDRAAALNAWTRSGPQRKRQEADGWQVGTVRIWPEGQEDRSEVAQF